MIQGTTGKVELTNLDVNLKDAESVYMTFVQDSRTLFDIPKDKLEITENSVAYTFTQDESWNLDPTYILFVQVSAKMKDGAVLKTEIKRVELQESLKKGVI